MRATVRVGANGLEGLLHPRPVLAAGLVLAQLLGRTKLAPRTSLNGHVGAHRRLVGVDIDLAAIKRIGRARKATVNDVVLTLVASGLSELLASRDESMASVQVLVPVSLRHPDDREPLGNQVTALVAELPVGDQAPARGSRTSSPRPRG